MNPSVLTYFGYLHRETITGAQPFREIRTGTKLIRYPFRETRTGTKLIGYPFRETSTVSLPKWVPINWKLALWADLHDRSVSVIVQRVASFQRRRTQARWSGRRHWRRRNDGRRRRRWRDVVWRRRRRRRNFVVLVGPVVTVVDVVELNVGSKISIELFLSTYT